MAVEPSFPLTLSVSHPMGEGRLAAGRQAGGEGERDPKFDVVRVRPKGCCIRSQFCKFEFGEYPQLAGLPFIFPQSGTSAVFVLNEPS